MPYSLEATFLAVRMLRVGTTASVLVKTSLSGKVATHLISSSVQLWLRLGLADGTVPAALKHPHPECVSPPENLYLETPPLTFSRAVRKEVSPATMCGMHSLTASMASLMMRLGSVAVLSMEPAAVASTTCSTQNSGLQTAALRCEISADCRSLG